MRSSGLFEQEPREVCGVGCVGGSLCRCVSLDVILGPERGCGCDDPVHLAWEVLCAEVLCVLCEGVPPLVRHLTNAPTSLPRWERFTSSGALLYSIETRLPQPVVSLTTPSSRHTGGFSSLYCFVFYVTSATMF